MEIVQCAKKKIEIQMVDAVKLATRMRRLSNAQLKNVKTSKGTLKVNALLRRKKNQLVKKMKKMKMESAQKQKR